MEEGLFLIAAGLLLLWSARSYADARVDVSRRFAQVMAERGTPRWLRRLVLPTGVWRRRTERRAALALGAAVLVAGVLRLLGVWS